MKTSELTGTNLDWWVAQTLGKEAYVRGVECFLAENRDGRFAPSTDWAVGGPLIHRFGISLLHVDESIGKTHYAADMGSQQASSSSYSYDEEPEYSYSEKGLHYGPTPLIAAMRCIVANKFGEEVND